MMGGGGSEILAKRIFFFRSMKDAGIFLGREKSIKGFFGYAKKSSDSFG